MPGLDVFFSYRGKFRNLFFFSVFNQKVRNLWLKLQDLAAYWGWTMDPLFIVSSSVFYSSLSKIGCPETFTVYQAGIRLKRSAILCLSSAGIQCVTHCACL